MVLASSDSMSYAVQWDNEKQTIMYCAVRGAWDWEVLHEAFGSVRQLADACETTYSLILDLSGLANFAGNMFLSNSRKLIENVHPRFGGHMAVIQAPELMQEMDGAARIAYPMQFGKLRAYYVETLDDARATLARKIAY